MASPYVRHVHSQAEVTSLPSEKSVVVVNFHAAWSGPCRAIGGFYSHLAAKHRAVTFVRLEVDLDSIGSLGQQYRLTELPTFITVKNAEEIDRVRGPNRRGLEDMVVKHAPESEPSASGSGSPDTLYIDDTSLLEYLDMPQVNCLNEAPYHTLKSIVEKKTRNTSEAYLESDADEQLLITLPFNQVVKVRSIVLYTKDPKSGPKDIKIDINNLALGFGDVESATEPTVVQSLQVSEDVVKEGKQIQLRFVRLQRVNSLHIFVGSNHGKEDITRIDAVDVYGSCDGQPAATTQIGGLRNFLETHERGVTLLRLFMDQGGIRNLFDSVLVLREALLLCPTGNEHRTTILGNLAVAIFNQYEQQGDYSDLTEVIPLGYQILGLHPPGHPGRAKSLNNLSNALLARYDREGSLADLSEATERYREALELCPLGHPNRAASLNNLSTALRIRYECEGSLEDLSEATKHYREALELCPLGHPNRAKSLTNLSTALRIRYEREGSMADLSEAMEHHREALELYPLSHPDRATSLNNLSNALLTRFEREGSLTDLAEAVERYQEALELRLPGNPDRAMSLVNLSNVLLTRFKREGSLADLSEAAERCQEALELHPLGHPSRASSLHNLSNALMARHEHEGSRADLSEATKHYREALELCPLGHPSRAMSLNGLSNALLTRYKREGILTDLSEAAERYRESLELCLLGHPDRAMILGNLSVALLTRYQHEGSLADLAEAAERCREALELCPLGHPDRATSLNNLSNALLTRYQHEGSLADLSEAMEHYREALELRPLGHSNRATSLNNLSTALRIRYEREGSLEDLSEATKYYREALELCPLGHPHRATSLGNLSNALLTRHYRERTLADLSEAMEYYQEALELHPLGHPDRASSLGSLSNALLARSECEGSLADLSEATEHYREALELSLGHPDRASSLHNLSNALLARYGREGSLTDLSEATEQCRKVLELRPPGHPARAESLSTLSRVLLRTIDCASDADDMQGCRTLVLEVLEVLREAVGLSSCPPRDRLRAAIQWIDAARKLDPESTLDAYTAALEQLDIVLATGNTLANKHTELSSSQELARCRQLGIEAVSYAMRQGHLMLAVELLERGRNLLFAQVGRYRADLENLRKVNVELADRFYDLSRMLDETVVSNQPRLEGRTVFEDPIERYRRVASDWSQVVDSIRAVEGFERFLRPLNYATLRSAAAEGPIIVVIPGDSQSDALLISHQHDTPHHINLPEATTEKLVELANSLVQAIHPQKRDVYDEATMEKPVKIILRSLWDLVVQPIADALEHELCVPLRSRVWWCPASILSALPLHAAGRYAPKNTEQNFPAKYVSSYTPTFQALSRARSKRSASSGQKTLIVAQPGKPESPGWLPNAHDEAELVKKLVEENLEMGATLLSGEEGTPAAVLERMVDHSWLHLTCHGFQDFANPFQSRFGLYDSPLTLHDIMQRGLPDAAFAFLAACHTATGDITLLDEGLHLAAGLHFAGFKSVVGTFWEVADIDGPVIAEAFYKALQEEGMDCSKAAYALSKAVQHLRDIGVPVHRWMRFIHIGI